MTVLFRTRFIDIVMSILLEEKMITGNEPITSEGRSMGIGFDTDKKVWEWYKWLDHAQACGLIQSSEIERD